MNKNEILSQIENAKNNYILLLGAISLYNNEKSHVLLDDAQCNFGPYSIQFKQIADMLRVKEDREIACKEIVKMGLRALIKESFELVKEYTKQTKQEDKLRKASWYQFARIIRNCLSHNFKFCFNKNDLQILPITWRRKQIKKEMNNSFLELKFFGYTESWELFDEMHTFIKNKLD